MKLSIQMRVSADDSRFYSPDRDLAYCSPHLIHRALAGLDPDKQEAWISDYLLLNSIDQEHLVEAAKCLADYANTTMLDPNYDSPYAALTASGFFNLRKEVQVIVLSKLGQVFLSAFFSCARDVTRDPKDPPIDLKLISEQAQTLVNKLAETRKPFYIKYWQSIKRWLNG